jgi:hypothetical protein
MAQKSKLVILDANVIIKAHELGVWNGLTSQYHIHLPSTVLFSEAKYFISKSTGQRVDIDMNSYVSSGNIQEIQSSADDLKQLQVTVSENFFQALDPGELEALAILHSGQHPDFQFCTGDQSAIKAMSVLGLSSQAVSFEKLLKSSGISTNGLHRSYSQDALNRKLAESLAEKIFYLKKK